MTDSSRLPQAILLSCTILAPIILIWTKKHYRSRTTQLSGPPSTSFIFGLTRETVPSSEHSFLYEDWEKQYGSVYQIPSTLGSKLVVLCDPKAVTHFYSKDTFGYRQTPMAAQLLEHYFGRNLLWAEAQTHKRQRKALTSPFSNTAIRELIPTFYNTAHTLKDTWDSQYFQTSSSSNDALIDIQKWMNYVTLDTIGLAGFGHDFGSLKGERSLVVEAFDSFGDVQFSPWVLLVLTLAQEFPILVKTPNKRHKIFNNIRSSIRTIADGLLEKAKIEKETGGAEGNKSIIGALLTSGDAGSMSYDEIISQYLFIIAGYETTATSLTWALIELSRNPVEQQKLRSELMQLSGEPTWEQLTHSLPYLDAVVCETLRLHPAGSETTRQAFEDDIIPLTKPIRDAQGDLIESIFIAKGTLIRVPIMAINRSDEMWGSTAKEFMPSRWMDNKVSEQNATAIQGYRHLLTFSDGPRTCLGKVFALTEFKIVLSTLIRNYTFELPDGPATKFATHFSMLERPKVVGQTGPNVPLIVRRVGS